MEPIGKDLLTQLTMACSLIFMNYFWSFPFQIIEPRVTKNMGSKTTDKDEGYWIVESQWNISIKGITCLFHFLQPSYFFWAAITKYCRPGILNRRNSFLTVLKTGKFQDLCARRFSVWWGQASWLVDGTLSLHPHLVEGISSLSVASCVGVLISWVGALSSCSNHFQRSYLQIPSCRGLGVQIWIREVHKHSDHTFTDCLLKAMCQVQCGSQGFY